MEFLHIDKDMAIPTKNHEYKDTYEKAKVACQTALTLNAKGMPIEVDTEDELFAQSILKKDSPLKTKEIFKPGAAIKLGAILTEYDMQVAKDAAQLRTVATNKLIELMSDPDPKIQIRAIELIGKIADVGLFAERTEITIGTRSTEDLEKELFKLVGDYIDVEAKEVTE
tara:strand:- start:5361 stop:5867 length:507 start_codon:yes stop_codon:yes gene_type:complete